MSIPTIHAAPHGNPQDRRDHALGRADAYDEHNHGATLTDLETRLEWLDDPRVSHYTAAYLAGYRALIRDLAAQDWAQTSLATADAYRQHHTPKGTAR